MNVFIDFVLLVRWKGSLGAILLDHWLPVLKVERMYPPIRHTETLAAESAGPFLNRRMGILTEGAAA